MSKSSTIRQPMGTEASRRALFDAYIPRIMQCRLEDLVLRTPVQDMPRLAERLGFDIQL